MDIERMLLTGLILIFSISLIDGAQINAVRFVPNTSILKDGRDGIIEILGTTLGNWGTVCNLGFNIRNAEVACVMMGYPPNAVTVLNTVNTVIPSRPIAMDIKCPTSATDFSECTMRYGVNNVNPSCNSKEYLVHVACLQPKALVIPKPKPIFSTTCGTSSNVIQLSNGSNSNNGLLRIRQNSTTPWLSVCRFGFDTNAAKAVCKTLCAGNGTDYARPVYTFGPGDGSPGTRMECPEDATALSQCQLFSDTTLCNDKAYAVGVDCGPMPETALNLTQPTLQCSQPYMIVTFNFTQNTDLTTNMVSIKGSNKTDACNITIIADANKNVIMYLPIENCGAEFQQTSENMLYTHTIHRKVRPDSNGVYRVAPVDIKVTCIIPRNESVDDLGIGAGSNTLAPLVDTDRIPVTIQLYTDALFRQPVLNPNTRFAIRQRLHAVVKATRSLKDWLLTLTTCWITASTDRSSTPSLILIQNKCVNQPDVILQPVNNTAMAFSFEVVQFPTSPDNLAQNDADFVAIYLHCNTRVCDVRKEGHNTCNRVCITSSRRKRDVSFEIAAKHKKVDYGPIKIKIQRHQSSAGSYTNWSILTVFSALFGFIFNY